MLCWLAHMPSASCCLLVQQCQMTLLHTAVTHAAAQQGWPTFMSFSWSAAHFIRAASLGGAADSSAPTRLAISVKAFLLKLLFSSLKDWLHLMSRPAFMT